MKNENGTGTVYKLKGKRRKPWVARITTGYSTEGKQVRKTLGTFTTKREAQEYLLKYNKNPLLFTKITFKEVKDMWWEEYQTRVRQKTIDNFKSQFNKLKDLEDIAIADINLMALQKVCRENKGNKVTKAVLNLIFEYALKYDFVSTNKCRFLEIEKTKNPIERKIFTEKEISELWERIDTTRKAEQKAVVMTLILIYTGLRIGEFLNLRNEDIDLENNVLYVKEAKTKAGERQVPISSKIVRLFNYFEREEEYLYKRCYNTVRTAFLTYIKNHTIHDTRHTFASLLNNAEANKTSITKLVGHTNFSMTENIYTHKDIEELRKAVEMIQ